VSLLLSGAKSAPSSTAVKPPARKLLSLALTSAIITLVGFAILFFFIHRWMYPKLELKQASFVVGSVDRSGMLKGRIPASGQTYEENLGDGVTLKMMEVPAGNFWMGSTRNEAEQVIQELRKLGVGNTQAAI